MEYYDSMSADGRVAYERDFERAAALWDVEKFGPEHPNYARVMYGEYAPVTRVKRRMKHGD
jgi:hypothetical protein